MSAIRASRKSKKGVRVMESVRFAAARHVRTGHAAERECSLREL